MSALAAMGSSLLVLLAGLALLSGIGGLLLRGWGGDALRGVGAFLVVIIFWLAVPW